MPGFIDLRKELEHFFQAIDASPALRSSYTNGVKSLALYLQANKIKQPTRKDIINYRNQLQKEGKRAATIQLYIIAIRRFFSWMEKEGILRQNPARDVKGAKLGDNFVKSWLTPQQAKNLLESIDTGQIKGKRDYALILLLITTGLRTIEAARAGVKDIMRVTGNKVLFIQGKGHDGKDAYVKLSPQVITALEAYLTARPEKEEALFTSTSRRCKGRLTTRSISRIIKNRLLTAGLDDDLLSAHSLRHTAATINLLAGGTLQETQQLLRHKNINTTLRYSHDLDRQKNDSETRITNQIFNFDS